MNQKRGKLKGWWSYNISLLHYARILFLALSLFFFFLKFRPLKLELSPEEEIVISIHNDTFRCLRILFVLVYCEFSYWHFFSSFGLFLPERSEVWLYSTYEVKMTYFQPLHAFLNLIDLFVKSKSWLHWFLSQSFSCQCW